MAKMPLCILKGRFPIYLALDIFGKKSWTVRKTASGKKTKSLKMSKRERIQEIDQPFAHSLINREIDKAAACFADKYPGHTPGSKPTKISNQKAAYIIKIARI